MSLFNVPTSVLLHHLKTSFYALSTVVLVGWVANALNEDLIFKLVMRYFFPEDVARYSHPFDSPQAFLIWFIPLLFSLMLMFGASMMTLHHFKKPHLYRLSRGRELHAVSSVIVAPRLQQLDRALDGYATAQHIWLLVPEEQLAGFQQTLGQRSSDDARRITLCSLKNSTDLTALRIELAKFIAQLDSPQSPSRRADLSIDLTFCSSLFASAAMFCALEQDIELVYLANGKLRSHDVTCVIEN